MTTTPFSLPVPGGMLSFTANGLMFTPSGAAAPLALPQFQQLQLPQGLPQLSLPGLAQGGAPDLSGLLSALAPVIGAAVPQLAPFLPIIGVVLNILHALTTQNTAAIASGTPNPALQLVHDSAWKEVLGAFAPKALPAPAAA